MNMLQLAILACIPAGVFTAVILLFFYFRAKEKYLLFWFCGWSLITLRFFSELVYSNKPSHIVMNVAAQLLTWASLLLVYKGIAAYRSQKLGKGFIVFNLSAVTAIFLVFIFTDNFEIILVSVYYSALIFYTAYRMISTLQESPVGRWIVGLGFGLIGLINLVVPFVWNSPDSRAYVYYPFSFVILISAVGLVFLYFEKSNLLINNENIKIKELQKELERYKSLADNIDEFVMFYNPDGTIIDVNRAALKHYGYSKDEFKQLSISGLRRSEADAHLPELVNQAIHSGISFESVHYTKDGASFPVDVNTIGLILDGKQALVSVVRDITDKEKIQQVLLERNKEALELLKELKVTQATLIQQEKLAGVGQLAAGVAHEINNPLGFVSSNFESLEGYVRIVINCLNTYEKAAANSNLSVNALLKNVAGSSKLDFIRDDIPALIKDTYIGLDRIKTIVSSLKNFARVDQGENRSSYDLNAAIADTLTIAHAEFKYCADIETNLSEIPAICANGGQLNQVLLNVIVNAAQVISAENSAVKGLIRITTKTEDDRLLCIIENTGPPLPDELKEKVFEPFFTTKPIGKGTGLGLGIAYDIIVNKHQGNIYATDSDLGGAAFVISLPLERQGDSLLSSLRS